MYIALTRFADLKDGNRIYEAGEEYPRLGFVVSDERMAELAGSDNRMGYPLIKAVKSPVEAADNMDEVYPSKRQNPPRGPKEREKRGDMNA